MKISYNWLKQFIDIDWEAPKTAELLTNLGLEVENIERFESIKGGLEGVVVGEVLTCKKHPNADRLHLTTVDIGAPNPLQIVCGAPNVAVGQKVPVATIGTTLYDKTGKAFPIKKGKIRGEESQGMICAEDELGLGDSHEGIMVLSEKLINGTQLSEVFELESDQIFEIGLTPNRADAMSHYGVARDIRAGLIQQEISKEIVTPSVIDFHVDTRTFKIEVEVEDKELAPRYMGLTISNVAVKESPQWLKNRLLSLGITPKYNIVDITNFVLHELGQPLHAFDADKIQGEKILVKTLPEGTKFTTLDGIERGLCEEDIMICDAASNPLCIGGVFGGLNSGVTENTENIFLESALFSPVYIRKTAKRHGLNTDASFRFERGVDVNFVEYALKRAALLIIEIAGGKITSDIQESYSEKIEDFEVVVGYQNIRRLIGHEISKDTIKSILTSLNIKIQSDTDNNLGVLVPSYRVDVQREVDVIEEIIRIYGYDSIEVSPKLITSLSFAHSDNEKLKNIIASQLVAQGYFETMTNSITKPEYIQFSDDIKEEHSVKILNPLSSDLEVMRQSMLFSGLESIAYNRNRQNNNLRFFEFGTTYHKYNSGYHEEKHLVLYACGNCYQNYWQLQDKKADFFYVKGSVVGLLSKIGIDTFQTKPNKNAIFSESIEFYVEKTKVAEIGVVKTAIVTNFGIKQEVIYADIAIQKLVEITKDHKVCVKELPKYPSVKRDLALLLDWRTSYEELYDAAFQTEKKLLKEVDLFDVYEGKNLPDGKKSYALSFVLRDKSKTLNDKQIDRVMQKLLHSFQEKFGAELRK